MHVGGAESHRPQGRCLEREIEGGILDLPPSALVGCCRTDVVELVIGKSPATVTGEARRLPREQCKTAFGGIRNGASVPGHPAIKRRNSWIERTLEGGYRLYDRINV